MNRKSEFLLRYKITGVEYSCLNCRHHNPSNKRYRCLLKEEQLNINYGGFVNPLTCDRYES